ncbi:MAG: hypothetical protein JW699_07005 [Chitinispirillaceae bacterium]|nr:hypothetical protein [Chitinispirillaceae bacterium]
MDMYTDKHPWDGLATRRLTLGPDRLIIHYKNIARGFEDEYDYGKIDPAFRTVRRGEAEWSNVVFGLVIASIVFFILTKMSSSLIFNTIVLIVQLCAALLAVALIFRIFIKKDHLYIMDATGDCILTLRATSKARAFAAKLKAKVEAAGSRDNRIS